MKNMICIYDLGEGNTELIAAKIGWWQKEGAQIKVVCPSWVKSDFEKLGTRGVEYVVIAGCRKVTNKLVLTIELLKRSIMASLRLREINEGVKVIYSISAVLDEVLIPFLAKLVKPRLKWVVLFENEVIFQRRERLVVRLLASLFYHLSLGMMKRADGILTISPELKKLLKDKGFREERIFLTRNAVKEEEIRRALRRGKRREGGLYMGRLDENKGVFELVEVMRIVVKECPSFQLKIVGSGEERVRMKLEKIIHENRLEKNISMLGYVTGARKYQILAESKIFIFPSKSESYGVSLLEAICSGEWAVAYALSVFQHRYKKHELEMVEVGAVTKMARKVLELNQRKEDNMAGLTLLETGEYGYKELARREYLVLKG